MPALNPGIVNQSDVTFDMDTDPPESSAPMIDSDLMVVDWEDILYRRPRYCGRDLHDMMNTDSSEPDVWKQMDTADLVYMCRTVAQGERWSDTDDNSDTDSVAELEYNTWDDAFAGEFRNALGNIPPGLIQNPPTDIIRNYETDDNSDTDSVAELENNTWDDTCAWECRIALLILIQNPPTDIMRTYTDNYTIT